MQKTILHLDLDTFFVLVAVVSSFCYRINEKTQQQHQRPLGVRGGWANWNAFVSHVQWHFLGTLVSTFTRRDVRNVSYDAPTAEAASRMAAGEHTW